MGRKIFKRIRSGLRKLRFWKKSRDNQDDTTCLLDEAFEVDEFYAPFQVPKSWQDLDKEEEFSEKNESILGGTDEKKHVIVTEGVHENEHVPDGDLGTDEPVKGSDDVPASDVEATERCFDLEMPARGLEDIFQDEDDEPEWKKKYLEDLLKNLETDVSKGRYQIKILYHEDDPPQDSDSLYESCEDDDNTSSSTYYSAVEDLESSVYDPDDEMSDSEIDVVESEVKGIFLDLAGLQRRLRLMSEGRSSTMQTDVGRFKRNMFKLDCKLKDVFYE